MKNPLPLLIALALLASCEKNPEDLQSEEMSNKDAAEIVAGTLVADINQISEYAGSVSYASTEESLAQRLIECGESISDEVSKEYSDQYVSYSFSAQYTATKECVFQAPVLLEYEHTSTSSFESSRISTSGQSSGEVFVELDPDKLSNYLMNADMQRSGAYVQKFRQQRSFTTASTYTITDLEINTAFIAQRMQDQEPDGYLIEGGSGAYQLEIVSGQGDTYTFTASIEFYGDGTAEVTINGQPFSVDLRAGGVVEPE